MNTTMADGANERLDAQIAEALFGQPGMSKMDVANRVRELRGDGPALLVGRQPGGRVRLGDQLRPCPFCGHSDFDQWPCEYIDASGANVVRCARCHAAAPMKVWHALSSQPSPYSVFDLEGMLAACVPGGDIADPQVIADNIRRWFAAQPSPGGQDALLGYVRVEAIKALREDDEVTGVMVHVEERADSVPVYLAARQPVGISAEWVLGYLTTDAPEDSREAIRNAFAEYAALSSARQPVCNVEGTWLWVKLMDWCKKTGTSPANQDELFAIAKEAHVLYAAREPVWEPVAFTNDGGSEDQFIADATDLNCPSCGGSGHADDARQPVGEPVCSGGFVISNGSGEKYMAWGQVGPEWTADRSAALWLVRRADAEALAAENEDAWSILPVERCTLPPNGWACTLAAGHEGPCPTIAAPPAQAVDLTTVRYALDAAEGLAVACASVDGFSREELASAGGEMRKQFADARALIDGKAVGNG
ncbi:TPA: hypothetical protein ACKQAW_003891 [Stenotrophomonas maltophilia]